MAIDKTKINQDRKTANFVLPDDAGDLISGAAQKRGQYIAKRKTAVDKFVKLEYAPSMFYSPNIPKNVETGKSTCTIAQFDALNAWIVKGFSKADQDLLAPKTIGGLGWSDVKKAKRKRAMNNIGGVRNDLCTALKKRPEYKEEPEPKTVQEKIVKQLAAIKKLTDEADVVEFDQVDFNSAMAELLEVVNTTIEE
jgi:hypothetical protein|tara:strand:+ start:569 stop:1153 length:585 start_codon:yes stop_codon:yes gene_type:complete